MEQQEGQPQHKIRRRRSPRRVIKGGLFLLACGLFLAAAIYTPLFTVQHIAVHGNQYLKDEDIVEIGRVYRGQPLFQLETDQVTANLMKDLRIGSAVVRRQFPDTIVITIEERRPLATVGSNYGYADLGREGKIVASYKNLRQAPLPLITGVEIQDQFVGDDNKDERIAKALAFLGSLNSNAQNMLSEVNVSNPDSVVAYTTSSVQIRLGSLDDRLEEKARLTQDFLDALPASKHLIDFVDFRYKAPYIRLSDFNPDAPEKIK